MKNIQEKDLENKYAMALELSGTGFYEIYLPAQRGFISDNIRDLLHLKSNDLSLEEFSNLLNKVDRSQFLEDIYLSINEKQPFSGSFSIKSRSQEFVINAKGAVYKGDTYESLLLSLTTRQINNDNDHYSDQTKFTDVLDYLPTPLMIIREDGKVKYINKSFLETTGYSLKDIPTLEDWVKSAYGDHTETNEEILSQLFEITKFRNDGQFRFLTKDNEVRHLHFYTAPLGTEDDGKKLILSIAADVTEVRQKENLLQLKAREMTALMNSLPHLIFTANADGVSDYVNEKWVDFTGRKADDLLSNGADIVYPEDLPKFSKYGEVSRSNVKPFNMDVRILHKSGQYRWVNIRAIPVLSREGKVIRWIGTGTDVHDKYVAEQSLLNKASEFIGLMGMLNHIVWVVNADGTPEFFNKSWYEYTGLTKEETWKDHMQAVHPSQREKTSYHIKLAWLKKKEYEVNIKLRRRDGEYEWFVSKGKPILNSKGEIIKYVGTITNINTHRQLEDALKMEVASLSEIIESVPLLAWTADSDGNVDFYNKRWYEFTGQAPDEAFGWGWKNILHPEDLSIALDVTTDSLKSGKGFSYETRLFRAQDKAYRWHLVKVIPVVNAMSNVKYYVGTATDIHEQKMLEFKKGQFLNIASHELRTPLTTLMGYLQLMNQSLDSQNIDEMKLFHKKTMISSEKINRLINDLLNLSNIDSGKIEEFFTERIKIDDLIKDILKNYRQLHPEKQFHLTGNTHSEVDINNFRIEQVFDNLFNNIFKYAPYSPIYVELEEGGDMVRISVKDNGNGIPKNKLEAIFDRFYRINESGTTSGLGVGLFIVKEIIEKHNGRIWAESNVGEGTMLVFELPIA